MTHVFSITPQLCFYSLSPDMKAIPDHTASKRKVWICRGNNKNITFLKTDGAIYSREKQLSFPYCLTDLPLTCRVITFFTTERIIHSVETDKRTHMDTDCF